VFPLIIFSHRQKLIDTPFTALTQEYSQCTDDSTYVFFNQLGSALGTMDLLIPFSVILTFIVLGFYQCLTKDFIPAAYDKDERDSALKAVAVSLLLARDKERERKAGNIDVEGHAPHGKDEIFVKLVKGLDIDSEYHGSIEKVKEKQQNLRSASSDNRMNYQKVVPVVEDG
jgi:hypothetical protein